MIQTIGGFTCSRKARSAASNKGDILLYGDILLCRASLSGWLDKAECPDYSDYSLKQNVPIKKEAALVAKGRLDLLLVICLLELVADSKLDAVNGIVYVTIRSFEEDVLYFKYTRIAIIELQGTDAFLDVTRVGVALDVVAV